jgi:site-specific recombinase XerD
MNGILSKKRKASMKPAQTFSIIIWAYQTRTQQTTLKCTLYARITVNGKRTEISLKREIDEAQWDKAAGKIKGRTPDVRDLNNYINEIKRELFNIYQELSSRNEFISAEVIKNRYIGEAAKQYTLLGLLDFHNANLKSRIGIDIAKATWIKFNTLEMKLQAFLKNDMKKADVYLQQLDYTFVTRFEYYLRSVEKIGPNTSMKYIRMMKKIMNDAIKKTWLDKNPFQAFKCVFRWPEKEVITWAELDTINRRHFAVERLQVVKDYFVFSCFTGLAYIDVVNLKSSAITIGIDGNQWLVFHRQKTGTLVRIPILDQALTIIEKYRNHPIATLRGSVFPGISNQKMNSYLKEIGDICGISKTLTFHLARHTFATTVTLSNGVPIESVSKMLGHKKIVTTQVYAKVVEKKLSEDMDILKRRISKNSSDNNILPQSS